MSAILKSAAIFAGAATSITAVGYSISRSQSDFSASALQASELDIVSSKQAVRPKLPSEFFSFTLKDFKLSNAA